MFASVICTLRVLDGRKLQRNCGASEEEGAGWKSCAAESYRCHQQRDERQRQLRGVSRLKIFRTNMSEHCNSAGAHDSSHDPRRHSCSDGVAREQRARRLERPHNLLVKPLHSTRAVGAQRRAAIALKSGGAWPQICTLTYADVC